MTIRLTGSNLLNGKKEEVFDKFASTADQIARDDDEYERESEEARPGLPADRPRGLLRRLAGGGQLPFACRR